MPNYKNLDECKSYESLRKSTTPSLVKILDKERIEKCNVKMSSDLYFNWASSHIDDRTLELLVELAREQDVIEKFKLLCNGEVMNTGENRMVLHHLTRGQLGSSVVRASRDFRKFYLGELEKISNFSINIREGKIKGSTNKDFHTIVQIGIGGSDLGPRAMCIALSRWARAESIKTLRAEFISNVDPDDAYGLLSKIDPERTLFVLVSKSGTTQETLANETLVRNFLKSKNINPDKHMVAVTSETSPLANNPAYLQSFYIDDYIGGRYSSSSAVGGVILSLVYGFDVFNDFLTGAHEADKIASEKEVKKNPALLDALIGVYNRNILGYNLTAVLPYTEALSRFPAHLQQLDMESNGKSINREGKDISYKTGPVVLGEPGTNGQHSFYQHLHQGTDIIPLQFIGFFEGQLKEDITVDKSTSRKKLNANLVAQIVAFARGESNANKNKNFSGNRTSTLIYGKRLTPLSLGSLLSHFENKIMFQGFIWNINSFDQEGVQLGKILAKKVLEGSEGDPVLGSYSKIFSIP